MEREVGAEVLKVFSVGQLIGQVVFAAQTSVPNMDFFIKKLEFCCGYVPNILNSVSDPDPHGSAYFKAAGSGSKG